MFHVPCVRVDVPPEADRALSDESLDRLGWVLSTLDRSPGARLHLAMTGASIDTLRRDRPDLVAHVRARADEGRVDFACTPHDAAPLPLLPEAEIERQLRRQEQAVERTFGHPPRRRLVWPTALALSDTVVRCVARLGFAVVLVDAESIPDAEGREGRRLEVAVGQPGLYLLPVPRGPAAPSTTARFAPVVNELADPSPDLPRLLDVLMRRRCVFAQELPGLVPTVRPTGPSRAGSVTGGPTDSPWAGELSADRSRRVARLSRLLHEMEISGLGALPARRESRENLDRSLRASRWIPPGAVEDLVALEARLAPFAHTSQ